MASAEPQVLGLQLTRIQDVVIGRYISAAAVGTYRIAWHRIALIAQICVSVVTLSQLQHDRERFRTAVSCLVTSLPHSALG